MPCEHNGAPGIEGELDRATASTRKTFDSRRRSNNKGIKNLTTASNNETQNGVSCEFHFQEGFSGQHAEIMDSTGVLARVELRTQFQTGLAEIETLTLDNGKEIIIRLDAPDTQAIVRIDASEPFILLNLIDARLSISRANRSPGYL